MLEQLGIKISANFTRLATGLANSNAAPPTYLPVQLEAPVMLDRPNEPIPQNIQNQLDRINPLLEAAMRESLVLLQAEKQERDSIEQQTLPPEDKNKKLAQIEQSFLSKRAALLNNMLKEISAIERIFRTTPNAENFTSEIETNIQALTDAVNTIIYPAATSEDLDTKDKPLIVEKKGGVTHFRKPSRFFGSVEKCTMSEDEDGNPHLHFTEAASGPEVDFIIKKLVKTFPGRKVILDCNQNYANLTAVAEGLMAKGFKPEDIKLDLKDNKTGKVERTDYAKYKGLDVNKTNVEAQKAAAIQVTTKTRQLTMALSKIDNEDAVLKAGLAVATRLDELIKIGPGIQQDAKIKGLVAQPEIAIKVMAQAIAVNSPASIAVSDKINAQIIAQSPEGLLATFNEYVVSTSGYRLNVWNGLEQMRQILMRQPIVSDGSIGRDLLALVSNFHDNTAKEFVAGANKYIQAEDESLKTFNAIHAFSTPTDPNFKGNITAFISFNPASNDALGRIQHQQGSSADCEIVIVRLGEFKAQTQLSAPQIAEVDQLIGLYEKHKQSLLVLKSENTSLQDISARCGQALGLQVADDQALGNQLDHNKLELAHIFVNDPSPQKIAQLLILANKKGDAGTIGLIAAEIGRLDKNDPKKQAIVDQLLLPENNGVGEKVLTDNKDLTESLDTDANKWAREMVYEAVDQWQGAIDNNLSMIKMPLLQNGITIEETKRNIKFLEPLTEKPLLTAKELNQITEVCVQLDYEQIPACGAALKKLCDGLRPAEQEQQKSQVSTAPSPLSMMMQSQ